MARAAVFSLALAVIEAALVSVLWTVDGPLPMPPRSPAWNSERPVEVGCRVDPLAPAMSPAGGRLPHVTSPSENARIYEAALRLLFDQPGVIDSVLDAESIWLASETRVQEVPGHFALECEIALWRGAVSVHVDTLRVFLRENLRPAFVPVALVSSPRGQKMLVAPRADSIPTCGPVLVRLSNPGVNREMREAVLTVTIRQNGSGGQFLVAVRQEGLRWRGVDLARLSFIDGFCEPPARVGQ